MASENSSAAAGRVVGVIEPNPNPGSAGPIFRRIGKHERNVDPAIRPCAHTPILLDDKWAAVYCGECKEKLDPYSVLSRYAEWYEYLTRKQHQVEEAERSLLRENLRRHRKIRGTHPTDRGLIDGMLSRPQTTPLEHLRELSGHLDKQEEKRRAEKRARNG